jgi:hypothetical protein
MTEEMLEDTYGDETPEEKRETTEGVARLKRKYPELFQ